MLVHKKDYFSKLQKLLVLLILNRAAKIKLAILEFLYCGEILKTLNKILNHETWKAFNLYILCVTGSTTNSIVFVT